MTTIKINDMGIETKRTKGTPPPPAEEVAVCRAWLTRYTRPCKTAAATQYSYGLKHTVEACWPNVGGSSGGYVSNGALIQAAIDLGYRVDHDHPTPNGLIWCKIRQPYAKLIKKRGARHVPELVTMDWLPQGVGAYGGRVTL